MNRILSTACAGLVAVGAHAQPFDQADLETARELRALALESGLAYDVTSELTTRIGNRLAGTEDDARAVEWAVDKLESLGFDRVWTEPATFPTWTREHERVAVTAPVEQELVALAIGFSPGTPEGGVEAEVVMFDDLAGAPGRHRPRMWPGKSCLSASAWSAPATVPVTGPRLPRAARVRW